MTRCMDNPTLFLQILHQFWGYNSFRPLQEEIIRSVYAGKDTLGLMPTGGGKSLTFQVPALAMGGVCIVVTPLIALMKDQVDNLKRIGVKATAVHSGMNREEIVVQLENCIFGDYRFLYVSPERLGTELFQNKMRAMDVKLLVIDECHCISQWGYDFRPSYLKIAEIREELPHVPVLALTATATPAVVEDIQEKLHFREKNVFSKSFARPNLAYIVRDTDNKLETLAYILRRVPGTAIAYVRNRKKTKEVADYLRKEGFSADFFHAGLNHEEKVLRQNRWKSGETRIIVSTNAFGMGIDKPDVRLVVHLDMPGSLEEYYQEAGRAGRDGLKSYAVALCSPRDAAILKRRTAEEFPDKSFIRRVYDALGNFYQIAVGFGLDTVHDFRITDFCAAYRFPLLQTHHALKILELSGYIEYVEEPDKASRLLFTATREELYKYLRQDSLTDSVLQVILRSYTGLFSDFAYINESEIATRAGCKRNEVYHLLVGLSKYGIVKYIPEKQTPTIVYRQTREEEERVYIPAAAYEERKVRSEARIQKVLEYIGSTETCRAKMLLNYFGEQLAEDCGTCDVCLSHHPSGVHLSEYHTIRHAIEKLLAEAPMTVEKIYETLSFPKEKLHSVVRYLADNDPHFRMENDMLFRMDD